MGIYNRDYYRETNSNKGSSLWGLDWITPVVKNLILINIVVFLLQVFVVRQARTPFEAFPGQMPEFEEYMDQDDPEDADEPDPADKAKIERRRQVAKKQREAMMQYMPKVSIVQEWLDLNPKKVVEQGQIWRLLTHAFCHDRLGIWHILFNMLFLFWFGCTLEAMYGSREFLLFYLSAAILAGLAYIGLDLYSGTNIPAVGASGAVMAVMMLYTMHFPGEEFRIFGLISLQMRWIMLFYLIFDLHPVLLALAGDRLFTGIGHAAHLGGLAFGFLYAKYEWRLDSLVGRFPWPGWKRTRRSHLRLAPETIPDSEPEIAMDRVDEILQKVYEAGQASLSEEERTILQAASKKMKRRPDKG